MKNADRAENATNAEKLSLMREVLIGNVRYRLVAERRDAQWIAHAERTDTGDRFGIEGTGATVNAFHPGLMKSNLMSETPGIMRWLMRLFSAEPERAAADLAYLASSPEVKGID